MRAHELVILLVALDVGGAERVEDCVSSSSSRAEILSYKSVLVDQLIFLLLDSCRTDEQTRGAG